LLSAESALSFPHESPLPRPTLHPPPFPFPQITSRLRNQPDPNRLTPAAQLVPLFTSSAFDLNLIVSTLHYSLSTLSAGFAYYRDPECFWLKEGKNLFLSFVLILNSQVSTLNLVRLTPATQLPQLPLSLSLSKHPFFALLCFPQI